jgi:hypothetical protein
MSSQRETLQKHQGNQTNVMSDLANQKKPDKNECGHSCTSFTHKVSNYHLHHEWHHPGKPSRLWLGSQNSEPTKYPNTRLDIQKVN